jgi:hypothetical protein
VNLTTTVEPLPFHSSLGKYTPNSLEDIDLMCTAYAIYW